MEELEPSQIIKCDEYIYYRGEKYQKVKEPPRMCLENQGEFDIVSYAGKIYYRLELSNAILWYKREDDADGIRLVHILDLETHRLLEGIWFNDVKRGQYDD